MRRLIWGLLVAVLVTAALPAAGPSTGSLTPAAYAQAAQDEEIVLLASDGRIVIADPTVPAGIRKVEWQSNDTGWQKVATGDFNGDGDDEIIALRGGEARVFDPIVQSGEQTVLFNQTVSGQLWEQVVTGDIDGDGQDEIILTRTTSEGDIVERMQAFDPNPSATTWTLTFNEGYGLAWQKLATGDVDGDGIDDVAAIRHRTTPTADKRITIWKPSANWQILHDRGDYDFKWLTIEIGNVDADASGREELLLSREGVLGTLNSFLVFRCCNGSSLITVAGSKHYPYFFSITSGDINASGDEEVFLLRNTGGTSSPALIMLNYGADPVVPFETLAGQGQWLKILAGDTDGDGRAELVVMSPSEYRIFTQPGSNMNFEPHGGSYIASGEFALGNLDGAGIPLGPVLTLSTNNIELNLEAGQGATQNVSVTNTGEGSVINWTATVTDGAEWLSVSPTSGSTPSTMVVVVNTSNLVAGSYTGKVKVEGATATNGPQEITVKLTTTAPQFSVSPPVLSWLHHQGRPVATQTVSVRGPGVPWAAGVVPISQAQALQEALQAGGSITIVDGMIVIAGGATPLDVPVVDWVDVMPLQGSATPDGAPVLINLVPNRVPWGYSEVALVFVALRTASPPAVVVRIRVLSYTDRSELHFIPLAE